MEDLSIRNAVNAILEGRIRIPAFQRGFVWDPERVAFFMDSIYKGYPWGSILIWRTKEALEHERDLGPYTLPEIDPDYPVDYVLDGQQRLTSVFGVFQTELEEDESDDWLPIYFDFDAETDAQDSQFVALPEEEIESERHFPLKTLFDPTEFRKATHDFDDAKLTVVDELQAKFKEAALPIQTFVTDDHRHVAIVFERVNRMGVELDTMQLLSAWTWSEEFDLRESFADLSEVLEPFGFRELGEDSNLLLRCCAAIVAGDASPSALVTLNGAEVRERFETISESILSAVDFVRDNLNVRALKNLPFSTLLVPLSVFFAESGNALNDAQRSELLKWFWRSCFSRRYSSGVLRNLKTDISGMVELAKGNSGVAGGVSIEEVEPAFFAENRFGIGNVNTKTAILLMAQGEPRSFISGSKVNLEEVLREHNRREFHHLFPRAFLAGQGRTIAEINPIANFAIISRGDNNALGGVAPSKYAEKMDENAIPQILASALCPESLFGDDYDTFLAERAGLLASAGTALIE